MTRLAVYCQLDLLPLSIIDVAPEFLVMLEAKPGWSARVAWPNQMTSVFARQREHGVPEPTFSQVSITACKYRFGAAYGWFLMVDNRDFADALRPYGSEDYWKGSLDMESLALASHAMRKLMGVLK